MFETFGPVVSGQQVTFRLFLPNNAMFFNGGDHQIAKVQVAGDFQDHIGGTNWDSGSAPTLTASDFRASLNSLQQFEEDPAGQVVGTLFSLTLSQNLPDDFYQYKFVVTFTDNSVRWVSDPCCKLTGDSNFENSGFVVGGPTTTVSPLVPSQSLKDMVIYEVMIDDITAQFRQDQSPQPSPVEAFETDNLPHIEAMGVNTIEFMPLMGVPTRQQPCPDDFDWGYIPNWLFAVENRYVQNDTSPVNKIYKLKELMNTLHGKGISVIFDGVFNHVAPQISPNRGFPYHWLYLDPADSPFTGTFDDEFKPLEDLDYNNLCAYQFIYDVCKYWLQVFQFDGVRFDFTPGFFDVNNLNAGLGRLISDLNISCPGKVWVMENLVGFNAINETNVANATGNWFDQWLHKHNQYVNGNVDNELLRLLNANFDYATGKSPVTYIDNHDHSTFAQRAGGRDRWFKIQPALISLLTAPGAPLIRNGQEIADVYFLSTNDSGLPCQDKRVNPRPVRWNEFGNDAIGNLLTELHTRLINIRNTSPALRSPNFFPSDNVNHPDGYGVFPDRDYAVFHRWSDGGGLFERIIVVVNYSDFGHHIDIPFSNNGMWQDLLSGATFQVNNFRLFGHFVQSNWGRIFKLV